MNVEAAFRAQAAHCVELGSPFTARLCSLLADRLAPGDAVSDRVLGWPNEPSNRGDALPLRLAGALHGLVLEERDSGLAEVYPPNDVPDAKLWAAVDAALTAHAPYILGRLDGPPQTNEVQRSAALAPGFLTVTALTGLPLVTSELGASAGLNQISGPLHLPLRPGHLGRRGLATPPHAGLGRIAAAPSRRHGQ